MDTPKKILSSIPSTILIGCILISLSILISGGVIKVKKPFGTTTTTTPTSSAAPAAASLQDKLVALASSQGIDTDKLSKCMDEKKFDAEIKKDMADAQTAGISGTPGFVIGKSSSDGNIQGIKISGAYPYEIFQQTIDKIIVGTTPADILASFSPEVKDQEGVGLGKTSVDDDPVFGDKDAPVTIIEFSDYECPFCKRHFLQTFPSLKTNYIDTGKAKLVFRDFIAVSSHNPAATTEAMAAQCVKDQAGDEAYFKLHDEVYSKTTANGGGI